MTESAAPDAANDNVSSARYDRRGLIRKGIVGAGVAGVAWTVGTKTSQSQTGTSGGLDLTDASGEGITISSAGQIELSGSTIALLGNVVSPALSGVPTAPTAAPLTNTVQVATTAYADGAVLASVTTPATLSNKRITRRVSTTNAPGATPTMNTDSFDLFRFTGLNVAITSMTANLSGTPNPGDLLMIQLTDNGTPRSVNWGTAFENSTVALPTTTTASAILTVGFIWNTVTSAWRCIAVA
jgi:hypothetical protein